MEPTTKVLVERGSYSEFPECKSKFKSAVTQASLQILNANKTASDAYTINEHEDESRDENYCTEWESLQFELYKKGVLLVTAGVYSSWWSNSDGTWSGFSRFNVRIRILDDSDSITNMVCEIFEKQFAK